MRAGMNRNAYTGIRMLYSSYLSYATSTYCSGVKKKNTQNSAR